MSAELVGDGEQVGDQVTAGTDRGPQHGGPLGVPLQWAKSAPVSAHHIGQQVRVEPAVIVAGRARVDHSGFFTWAGASTKLTDSAIRPVTRDRSRMDRRWDRHGDLVSSLLASTSPRTPPGEQY